MFHFEGGCPNPYSFFLNDFFFFERQAHTWTYWVSGMGYELGKWKIWIKRCIWFACVYPEENDVWLPMTQQGVIILMFFGEKAALFLDISENLKTTKIFFKTNVLNEFPNYIALLGLPSNPFPRPCYFKNNKTWK